MSSDLEAIFASIDSRYFDFEDEVGDIIQNGGIVCEGSTKRRCPVKTGRLRSSYQYAKVTKLECSVGTNVKYAPPVELSHVTKSGSHVPAKPHLFPGFQDGVNAIIDDLKDLGV